MSGGPKNYAFLVFCNKIKVNGKNLNYENSKVLNFFSLMNMILENAPPVHVHNPRKIKRKHGGVFVSKPEMELYNVFLRSAGFWKILSPYPMDIRLYICLFICINRGVLHTKLHFI